MKYGVLAASMLAVCGTIVGEAAAQAQPFGQETVQTRPPRYQRAPNPAYRHNHSHAHAHPHNDGRVHDHQDRHPEDRHFGHAHGIETEFLFGFIAGSDTHHRGEKTASIEIVGRIGKRDGRYEAFSKKLEFVYGIADSFNAAISVSAARHRIVGVTGFDDVNNGLAFNGIGGEFRWNLAKRTANGIGVTLHFEPVIQRHNELSGLRGRKYGAENKLIFDTELLKDRLFAAFNLQYEVERVLEAGGTEWEKGSKLGLAFALTGRVAPNLYLGFNAQYQRAYEGLLFGEFTGEALYLGPTLFAKIGDNGFLSLAWNRQVWGEEAGGIARLDLANFERDLFRMKAGIEF
ncbi:MAG: hypothetical protein K2P86_05065 [Xanthobacteraceae bacterium]|nr:hypothetical protein [Xanthobacteraceae bacterium]